MNKIGKFLRDETRQLLPGLLFFFFSFQLLALTDALIAKQYGMSTNAFLNATLLALVVAKVVLISDHLPFVNRFPQRPLIYNILWKTAIYYGAALLVRYVEHLIRFWRESAGFAEANQRLFTEISWPRFWGVQIWLLVLLLTYCAFRELVRALGRDKIIGMFFREPGQPDPHSPSALESGPGGK